MKILESTTVEVKYGEQCTHLIVHVVDGEGPNLLGRDWLGKLNINQLANIHTLVAPSKLDKVLDKHALLFKEGIGMLRHVKIKLQVNQDVPPKCFKARSIPFALKGKG